MECRSHLNFFALAIYVLFYYAIEVKTNCFLSNEKCWNSSDISCQDQIVWSNSSTTVNNYKCKTSYCDQASPNGPTCQTYDSNYNNITTAYCFQECGYNVQTNDWMFNQCFNTQLNCFNSTNPICKNKFVYTGSKSRTIYGNACRLWSNIYYAIYGSDGIIQYINFTYENMGKNSYCRMADIPNKLNVPYCIVERSNGKLYKEPCFNDCSSITTTSIKVSTSRVTSQEISETTIVAATDTSSDQTEFTTTAQESTTDYLSSALTEQTSDASSWTGTTEPIHLSSTDNMYYFTTSFLTAIPSSKETSTFSTYTTADATTLTSVINAESLNPALLLSTHETSYESVPTSRTQAISVETAETISDTKPAVISTVILNSSSDETAMFTISQNDTNVISSIIGSTTVVVATSTVIPSSNDFTNIESTTGTSKIISSFPTTDTNQPTHVSTTEQSSNSTIISSTTFQYSVETSKPVTEIYTSTLPTTSTQSIFIPSGTSSTSTLLSTESTSTSSFLSTPTNSNEAISSTSTTETTSHSIPQSSTTIASSTETSKFTVDKSSTAHSFGTTSNKASEETTITTSLSSTTSQLSTTAFSTTKFLPSSTSSTHISEHLTTNREMSTSTSSNSLLSSSETSKFVTDTMNIQTSGDKTSHNVGATSTFISSKIDFESSSRTSKIESDSATAAISTISSTYPGTTATTTTTPKTSLSSAKLESSSLKSTLLTNLASTEKTTSTTLNTMLTVTSGTILSTADFASTVPFITSKITSATPPPTSINEPIRISTSEAFSRPIFVSSKTFPPSVETSAKTTTITSITHKILNIPNPPSVLLSSKNDTTNSHSTLVATGTQRTFITTDSTSSATSISSTTAETPSAETSWNSIYKATTIRSISSSPTEGTSETTTKLQSSEIDSSIISPSSVWLTSNTNENVFSTIGEKSDPSNSAITVSSAMETSTLRPDIVKTSATFSTSNDSPTKTKSETNLTSSQQSTSDESSFSTETNTNKSTGVIESTSVETTPTTSSMTSEESTATNSITLSIGVSENYSQIITAETVLVSTTSLHQLTSIKPSDLTEISSYTTILFPTITLNSEKTSSREATTTEPTISSTHFSTLEKASTTFFGNNAKQSTFFETGEEAFHSTSSKDEPFPSSQDTKEAITTTLSNIFPLYETTKLTSEVSYTSNTKTIMLPTTTSAIEEILSNSESANTDSTTSASNEIEGKITETHQTSEVNDESISTFILANFEITTKNTTEQQFLDITTEPLQLSTSESSTHKPTNSQLSETTNITTKIFETTKSNEESFATTGRSPEIITTFQSSSSVTVTALQTIDINVESTSGDSSTFQSSELLSQLTTKSTYVSSSNFDNFSSTVSKEFEVTSALITSENIFGTTTATSSPSEGNSELEFTTSVQTEAPSSSTISTNKNANELTTALTSMLTTSQFTTSDSTIVPQFQYTSEKNMSTLANATILTTPTQEITTTLVGSSQSTTTFELLIKHQLIHNTSYLYINRGTSQLVIQASEQTSTTTTSSGKNIEPMKGWQKVASTVLLNVGSIWIIGTTVASFLLLLLLRSKTYERFLHQCEELTLFFAQIFIIFGSSNSENKILCQTTSSFLQYLYVCCFLLFTFESVQTYCIHTQVISSSTIMSKKLTTLVGFGAPAIVTLITSLSQPSDLITRYSCWLNLDSPLVIGTLVPVGITSVIIVVTLESTSMHSCHVLPSANVYQMHAALVSMNGMWFKFPLHFASWLSMMVATYYQYFPAFAICFGINVAFACTILFFHLLGDDKVKYCMKKLSSYILHFLKYKN